MDGESACDIPLKVATLNLFTPELHKFHPSHSIATLHIAHPEQSNSSSWFAPMRITQHIPRPGDGCSPPFPFCLLSRRHLVARDKFLESTIVQSLPRIQLSSHPASLHDLGRRPINSRQSNLIAGHQFVHLINIRRWRFFSWRWRKLTRN